MRRGVVLTIALLGPAAALAQAVPAPRAGPRGQPSVTISPFATAALTSDDLTGGSRRSGSGFGLAGAWGLTDRMTFVGDLAFTDLTLTPGSSYHLTHAELLVRLSPRRPFSVAQLDLLAFLEIGGGLVDIRGERPNLGFVEKHGFSGTFITIGAGTNVFFRQRWAVTVATHGSLGTFSQQKVGNVTQGSLSILALTSRSTLGLSWYPWRGR